jgi:hypothetical protein
VTARPLEANIQRRKRSTIPDSRRPPPVG